MLKKKGNKKEGYSIIRSYTEGHSKITRPIMTTVDGVQQLLTFTELELLSECVAYGKIEEDSFIIYETDGGTSYKVLHSVMEFRGLKPFEMFYGGIELKSKEYIIFRKMEGTPLEKLKCRVRNNQFITGKDIMLFPCGNKLKMINFDCEKLKMFGNLALLRGSLAGVKSNWVLDAANGTLYKTTFSFKYEDVVSVDIHDPYILLETSNAKAFAYIKGKDNFDTVGTHVVEFKGDYRFKEFYLYDSTVKRGVVYAEGGERYLFLEGNVFTVGAMLNIKKCRYVLDENFDLKPITAQILADANEALISRCNLEIALEKPTYFIQKDVLKSANAEELKGTLLSGNIFDDVKAQEGCEVEFLLNDYLLQQYKIGFTKKELTSNFSTPNTHIVKAQNGLSEHEKEYAFKTLYPRLFNDYLVFEELCLQKTLIIDLKTKSLARKTDMEFVMPIKQFLLGVKDASMFLELNGLSLRCDFLKFTEEGLMLLGQDTTGYYAFLVKDTGSINPITTKKFLATDYYAVYDAITWQNTYAKSLPSFFGERKKLNKLEAF